MKLHVQKQDRPKTSDAHLTTDIQTHRANSRAVGTILRPENKNSAMAPELSITPVNENVIQLAQKDPVVKRYEKKEALLKRELIKIRKITNKRNRKTKQIAFMKKLLVDITGANPFKKIEFGKLSTIKTVRSATHISKVSVGANAETEWVDDLDHSKGIKVTFNETMFNTDPLESIISTVMHESVHARQLKSGVPYQSVLPRSYSLKNYYKAVQALMEVDAYLTQINEPFYKKKVPASNKKTTQKSLKDATADAKTALNRMSATFRYQQLQLKLEKLLPKFKGIQKYLWLKTNPLPWTPQITQKTNTPATTP